MDGASAVIAFVQAAGMCVKLGKALIQRYKAYKHANKVIGDLIIRIEGVWVKTEIQVQILSKIQDGLDDSLRVFQAECLLRLLDRLEFANLKIEKLTGSDYSSLAVDRPSLNVNPVKKVQFSLLEKHLQKTVNELESWHATFDLSWFLIGRIADTHVDTALKEPSIDGTSVIEVNVIASIRQAIADARNERGASTSIFQSAEFVSANQILIPDSRLRVSQLQDASEEVLIDQTAFGDEVNKMQSEVQVRDLARLLSLSDPSTLGLLECLGVIKTFNPHGSLAEFQFIFKIPPTLSSPQVLRTLLSQPSPSLDVKFRIAKSLARGVMAVHTADFVHKSIRPENIVVFCANDSSNPLPTSFLTGFERFRASSAGTNLTGDMLWERNIYRHPTRQGIKPEHVYLMQHDVYSLGVCLLELGVWTSFVTTSTSGPPTPGIRLDISHLLGMKDHLKASWDIKKVLTDMATSLLPSAMGLTYTEVVLSCLTCLDANATNMFGEVRDLYDEDGILVGVTFIEKILLKLDSVSL